MLGAGQCAVKPIHQLEGLMRGCTEVQVGTVEVLPATERSPDPDLDSQGAPNRLGAV